MDQYILIPLLPLIAFVINILLGKSIIRDKAHWRAVLALLGSVVLSVVNFAQVAGGKVINQDIYSWIISGSFKASVGFVIEPLTAILIVVTGISLLVYIYSIGYMHGDGGYYRFFAYLSSFPFRCLCLCSAIISFSSILAGRQLVCAPIS